MQIHGTTADKLHVICVHCMCTVRYVNSMIKTNGKWMMLVEHTACTRICCKFIVDFCMGDRRHSIDCDLPMCKPVRRHKSRSFERTKIIVFDPMMCKSPDVPLQDELLC